MSYRLQIVWQKKKMLRTLESLCTNRRLLAWDCAPGNWPEYNWSGKGTLLHVIITASCKRHLYILTLLIVHILLVFCVFMKTSSFERNGFNFLLNGEYMYMLQLVLQWKRWQLWWRTKWLEVVFEWVCWSVKSFVKFTVFGSLLTLFLHWETYAVPV